MKHSLVIEIYLLYYFLSQLLPNTSVCLLHRNLQYLNTSNFSQVTNYFMSLFFFELKFCQYYQPLPCSTLFSSQK